MRTTRSLFTNSLCLVLAFLLAAGAAACRGDSSEPSPTGESPFTLGALGRYADPSQRVAAVRVLMVVY